MSGFKYKYLVFNMKSAVAVTTFVSLVICAAITFYLASSEKASSASAQTVSVSIIIDAGHGGIDGGTQSADGTLEKDINLSIAQRLNELLTALGYSTAMTRTEDMPEYDKDAVTVRQRKVSDTRNRMKIIEANPDAVFISIHQNYFTQSKYNGTQVFYSGNNENSKDLAEYIQKSVVAALQPDNSRVIKKSGSDIYILHHAKLPAVMVECGFLSNSDEAALLKDSQYQQKMALAILDGILKYFSATE